MDGQLKATLLDAFAACAPGLEGLVAAELDALGCVALVPSPGGVAFRGTQALVQRVNLHAHVVSRVLVRVGSFRARGFPELERHAGRLDWSGVLSPGMVVQFRVSARKSKLSHQGAIAERLGAALVRVVPGLVIGGTAADGDDEAPDVEVARAVPQLVVVRVLRDEVTVSVDSSGEHLHRRGYRVAVAKAPLRETLAAAMLLGAGWGQGEGLVDPCCGSGTIVCEAARMARRIAPGYFRAFAFEAWPTFDRPAWIAARAEAKARVLPASPVSIVGRDRDAGAIEAARVNAERAGVAGNVQLEVAPLSSALPVAKTGLLLTNPPYGARLGDVAALRDLYARFGQLARGPFAAWRSGMLAADAALVGQAKLEMRVAWQSVNGGIPVALMLAEAVGRVAVIESGGASASSGPAGLASSETGEGH